VADFKYYQPQQGDSLNPAYEMLAQAQAQKAAAIGGFLNPLIDAMKFNRQSAMQQAEQDRLIANAADEKSYRSQSMGLQRDELQMKRDALKREQESTAALMRAHAHLLDLDHPQQDWHAPMAAPQGGATAESMLGGGYDLQRDLAMMTPQDQNTLIDNIGRIKTQEMAQAKAQREQDTLAADASQFDMLLTGLPKGRFKDDRIGAWRAQGMTPEGRRAASGEIATEMGKFADEERDRGEWEAQFKASVKQARTDYKDNPAKLGEIQALESLYKSSAVPYKQRSANFATDLNQLRGIGKEPKAAPGIDLPGIGQNITLNTSLDRREKGGAYTVNGDKLVGLSAAEAGELNRLVDTATSHDRLFDDSLMMVLAGDKLPPEYQANLNRARDVERTRVRKDLLSQLGWNEAQGPEAQQSSEVQGKADASEAGVGRAIADAIKAGTVKQGDEASLREFLVKTYKADDLMAGNKAAAQEYKQSRIRGAVAGGKGHTQDMSTAQLPADEGGARQAVETAKTLMGTYRDGKTEDALRARARYDLLRSLFTQKFGKEP
jgi:hypothetical protein